MLPYSFLVVAHIRHHLEQGESMKRRDFMKTAITHVGGGIVFGALAAPSFAAPAKKTHILIKMDPSCRICQGWLISVLWKLERDFPGTPINYDRSSAYMMNPMVYLNGKRSTDYVG